MKRIPLWVMVAGAAFGIYGCSDSGLVPLGLRFEPSVVDFGLVPVGVTARRTIEVTNLESRTLFFTDFGPEGALSSELFAETLMPALLGGAKMTVELALTPAQRGVRQGWWRLTTEDDTDHRILVRGVGVGRAIQIQPPWVDFGRVPIGQTRTATVQVKNTGNTMVTVEAVTRAPLTSSEFRSDLVGSQPLEPGEDFLLEVRYRPRESEFDEGAFILAAEQEQPEPLSFDVRGEGTDDVLAIRPSEILVTGVFPQETRLREVELRNTTTENLMLTSLGIAEGGAGRFRVVSPELSTFPLVLASGDAVRVQLELNAGPGPEITDTLEITLSDGGVRTVPLSATVVAVVQRELIPSVERLDFGASALDAPSTRSIRLRYVGTRDIEVSGPTVVSPFSVVSGPLTAFAMSPGDEAVWTVVLTPRNIGTVTATATWRVDGQTMLRIPMEGIGVESPTPNVSVTIPFVGRVPRGQEVARWVTIQNDGSAPAMVGPAVWQDNAEGRYGVDTLGPWTLAPGERTELRLRYLDGLGAVGSYPGRLRIPGVQPSSELVFDGQTVAPPPSAWPMTVVLEWSDDADLDLHVVRDAGLWFDRPDDVCFCNPNPDWGALDVVTDDALYVQDARGANGEERVLLWVPPGQLAFAVHHKSGASTVARLSVYQEGTLVFQRSQALASELFWEAASWSGGRFSAFEGGPTTAPTSTCF